MTRQTGPCWSSWMSSGTTSLYPTSLFLVLVCVLVTSDNEVTWWSVASVAGRERMQKTTWYSVPFARLCTVPRLLCSQTYSCLLLGTLRTPSCKPPLMDLDRALRNMGRTGIVHTWPGLGLLCVAHGHQSYANFPWLSRLLEATEGEPWDSRNHRGVSE